MACPGGDKFTAFESAMQNLDLWQAGYCMYATPLGELVVGTMFYGAVSLAIFVRTGSIALPAILYIILGSTVTAEMLGIVSPIIGLLVVLAAPIAVTMIVWNVDRLG